MLRLYILELNIPKKENQKMNIKNLTYIEKQIISVLARKGPKTYYDLYTENRENVGSRGAVNQALKRLLKKGLIEVKRKEKFPTGLEKKFYGLTFLGLHYSLILGAIELKEAKIVMEKNNIHVPTFTYDFNEKMKASWDIPILGPTLEVVTKKLTPEILFKIEEIVIKEANEEFFSKLIKIDLSTIKGSEEYAKIIFVTAYWIFLNDLITRRYQFEETDALKNIYKEIAPDIISAFLKETEKTRSILKKRRREIEKIIETW